MQSDKTLTTQIQFLLTKQRMESLLIETMSQLSKEIDQLGEIQKLINIFLTKKFQKS